MKAITISNGIFYLILIFLVAILKSLGFSFIHELIFPIIFFNIITDVLFKYLLEKWNKSLVVIKTVVSTFIRLFLSLIFILFFENYGVENLLNFILNFLIVYLLFIIFEITILLLNLHHIK